MRKLSILLMTALIFVACDNNSYKITGEVKNQNLDGKKVYLLKPTDESYEKTDSAIIENNSFTFEGVVDSLLSVKALLVEGEEYNAIHQPIGYNRMFIIEPGKFKFVLDTICTVTAEGKNGGWNTKFNTVKEKHKSFFDEANRIGDIIVKNQNNGTLTDSLRMELDKERDKLYEDYDKFMFDFIKKNIANPLGEYLFFSQNFSYEQYEDILNNANESFKSKEKVKSIVDAIEQYNKVKVGEKYIDFTMKDPKDKEISLSQFAGKDNVVLVDFWASWCGPCVRELPNLVALYAKYKEKGFEIVGVSLDNDKEKWTNMIKSANMTWPQMSEIQGWETSVVDTYAFRYIPYTVLIDKEGTIIARDLRGEDLEKKLAEIFGE